MAIGKTIMVLAVASAALVVPAAVGSAKSVNLEPGARKVATDTSSTLAGLVDKEAIGEQLTLYALLIDGDGKGRDARRWADELWTEDAVFQVFDADGKSIFGNPTGLVGREAIFATFGHPIPDNLPIGVRHVFGAPRFDFLTPNIAETRTIGFVIRGTKAEPEEPSEMQRPLSSYVFHDSWRKGGDGIWRKASTTVYCGTGCARSPAPDRSK